jgi:predicted nuclease with TOPRIM domain
MAHWKACTGTKERLANFKLLREADKAGLKLAQNVKLALRQSVGRARRQQLQ